MKKLKIIAIASCFLCSMANAQQGTVQFKEGNNGSQSVVATYTDLPGQNYDRYQIPQNDEARSVILSSVRQGCIISVFDNGFFQTNDDYCVIEVLQTTPPGYIVPTFQRNYTDQYIRQTYRYGGNLDGKVSSIRIN